MRNIKMKFKIFFLTILFLISLNSVSAYEVYEGEVESTSYIQTNRDIGTTDTADKVMDSIGIVNPSLAKDLKTVTVMIDIDAWDGTHDYQYQKSDVVYKDPGDNIAGTGYVYYRMMNTDSIPGYDKVYIKAYIDDGLTFTAPYYYVKIEGDVISYLNIDKHTQMTLPGAYPQKTCFLGYGYWEDTMKTVDGYHSASHTVTFYNNYSYWYDEDLFTFELTRDSNNLSMLYINNQYEDLINETSYESTITSVYSDDITNHTWNIEIYDINSINHVFQIDLNSEPENTTSTLTFNQSTYYINETMEYEYTNLNYLHTSDKYYDLVFYYYTSEDSIEYLYIQSLTDYDNTGYLSTYGWTPKKLYYGVIDNSLNYKTSDTLFLNNVKLSNYMTLTYDYEFIYISCEGDYCQYENGDSFIITYNSFNDHTLNVKDNNSNIVQSLGTINNFGTISYTIPYDNEKQYSYPYWNISFNESYENVIVFWSIQEDEINYQDEVVNESIQTNIDEIKEGVKPLFDLAIGLSTIIVDNPDYDNNGVTSSSELDRWFNSIISIVILLALYIFYKGLKDRGSK